MKTITQEESMGCAVACVASILEIPYVSAKKLFAKPENAVTKGYYYPEIIDVLKKAGLNYKSSKITNANRSLIKKQGTIIFVSKSKKYPSGHYLLKTKKGYMNSWINFPTIFPTKSGIEKNLPGKPQGLIYKIK